MTRTPNQTSPTRRACLQLAAAALAAPSAASAEVRPPAYSVVSPAQTSWPPPPPQAPVTEGMADVGGVRLSYWDTGGPGEPLILLHPATGSGEIWEYQQPVFAKAGYRVISYSRRGAGRSEPGPPDRLGTPAGDLHALSQQLGLSRFHLVGSAAGGQIGPDYVLSHPERVLSLVIACSLGVGGADYARATATLLPPGFNAQPPEYRELGPSYRFANPEGVARWVELEKRGTALRQPPLNLVDWPAVATIRAPTLILTADADPYLPPSRARDLGRRFPNAEVTVIPESGHSAYWEQPVAFNRTVLAFLARHKGARR